MLHRNSNNHLHVKTSKSELLGLKKRKTSMAKKKNQKPLSLLKMRGCFDMPYLF